MAVRVISKIKKITPSFFQEAYSVSQKHCQIFEQLFSLFQEENKKINLSSLKIEKEIWEKHFYDSLLAAEFLEKENKILDLGSGGGFPLLPLAIIFPQKTFFSIESVQKKCRVLEKFCQILKLKNVHILAQRAEQLAFKKDLREQFDCVTARAFAPFSPLLEIALPFLKIKGKLISFRSSKKIGHEKKLIDFFEAKLSKIVFKKLPRGDKRELWIIEKQKVSPVKFPRKSGIPQKRPFN